MGYYWHVTQFKKNVIKIVSKIPKGKVVTYGQVALLAGSPGAARQIAGILRSSPIELPWHRVINAKGEISTYRVGFGDFQEAMLKTEGIHFVNNKIDLKKYRWQVDSEMTF